MSTEQRQALAKQITDISSMLLSIDGGYLLLPGVCVAEIVTFMPAEQDQDDPPAWYMGQISWRNQNVPLVIYEVLKGNRMPHMSENCRIAVLNNTGQNHQLKFFAIVIQSTPRLLRVLPEDIRDVEGAEVEECDLMHVEVFDEKAIVPDVRFMEKAIIDYLELA